MKREIFVVGDIEIGGGTFTDDFISDRALAEFTLMCADKKHSVDLILNGDTFDFLKCPYIDNNGTKSYPRHVTEEISVGKLMMMYNAHSLVFEAWKQFVKHSQHRLIFIIGNHDQDLVYKEVQQKMRGLLGKRKNVLFKMRYRQHGVHVEHGHQYDLINRMNLDKLFVSYKGMSILNLSWVSLGIISDFLTLKEQHPFMERIKPWPRLFSLYSVLAKKLSMQSIKFLIKSLLYYPFRYYSDPTYTFPRTILREIYYRFKNFDWEVEDVISSFKKKVQPKRSRSRIFVFGHVHRKHLEENEGWTILQPDTWRDEYVLDSQTNTLHAKKKNYVQILIEDNDELQWHMNIWPIERKPISFNEVIKDEFKFLRQAAEEEGYSLGEFTTITK